MSMTTIQIPVIEAFPIALDFMKHGTHRVYYTCVKDNNSQNTTDTTFCEKGRKVFEDIPFTHKHICAFAVKGETASEYSKNLDAHFEKTHEGHKVVPYISPKHLSTTSST
jgi:deoxyadenosine/deoxycytidine kinase